MAATALLQRLTWLPAVIADARTETPQARTLVLDVPGWPGHRAGQHVDVRLTAGDGYQAVRSYSLASAPGEEPAVTVARVPDGEVSPYLVDVARPGDQVEIRGPVGGYFVWEPAAPYRSVLLVGGGSGVVPLRSILRHHRRTADPTPMRLVYSVRAPELVIYREELQAEHLVYTRTTPPGWPRPAGHLDQALLREVAWPPADSPLAYVCGPTAFVEHLSGALLDLGYRADDIRTERYG
ncbi:ferredoxin reductase [Nonomuraea sp. NPDC050663]|uniref:ferredoxin reductase n=1 Tax=Nonomuraea sp. NPDC050663 TaxID=3364370 RepID=UPI00378ABCAE